MLSFAPISIAELQERWLRHDEHALRLSVHTVPRYRAAANHLINSLAAYGVAKTPPHSPTRHAEDFVRYLRTIKVSPNGRRNTQKRPL